MTGKHQGQRAVIVGIEPNGRALVQIDGLPYERSYDRDHLEYRGKIEQELTTGEARRKRMAALVRAGKMCPSYPHQCTGSCIDTVHDERTKESKSKLQGV